MRRNGWVAIYRKIQDNYLWADRPFAKGQAWIDMLLLAYHDDNKLMMGNELVKVESGSFVTSELKLMERWGWSKCKTRAFLDLLQNDGMITKKTDRKKTTITIVNYGDYATLKTTNRPQKNHEQTTKRPPTDTNNNYNNYNNYIYKEKINKKESKHKYGLYENVSLSDADLEKLKEEFSDWEQRIERLSEYIASTGKVYKNHLATIRAWERRDKKPITKPKEDQNPTYDLDEYERLMESKVG